MCFFAKVCRDMYSKLIKVNTLKLIVKYHKTKSVLIKTQLQKREILQNIVYDIISVLLIHPFFINFDKNVKKYNINKKVPHSSFA